MTHPTKIDPKRFIDAGLGNDTCEDLEMPDKTLKTQEDFDNTGVGKRPKATALDKGIREEKEALNEAKGVTRGQVK